MSEISAVQIRRLKTLEEYQAVERIEREAWAITDPRDYVPLHLLVTAEKNGGLVAGAFMPDDTMVGFIFGFLGMTADKRLKHCSHMAAVLPSAQKQQIGYQLKLFQRQEVLQQGLALITWTYDPLQRANARLNIGKLGAVARIYHHNLYGSMSSGLNSGVSSDRFEVEWQLNNESVIARLEGRYQPPRLCDLLKQAVPFALEGVQGTHGLEPRPLQHSAPHQTYLVEIPPDINALKQHALHVARAWRAETARVFTDLFERGYLVHDFISEVIDGRRREVYVLSRNRADLLA
ncbi:MAG: hypothetical protein CUN49_04655 [Candidatus Thermofonsia Clade 1 bacterium]|jgi:predicted GNAT superfamily acetyltransferase|uniref:N-acetyltransferase domain-containing protein n=1 Tax=Candidatus Thermofonsia Clade 1 bacterium TaxID=2364210 RepID=A0A2M8PGC6_9CHLR|nr:MAG: hypothetical protein CUN49_04655 [Candidatus Thermofonsia Clade 1 bacterium]RMF52758.1 MAG: hypothetical protein D6749_04090 [Chloroflexota bacterium]